MLNQIKNLLHASKKEIVAIKDPTTISLIKILNKSEIGSGEYGIIYNAKISIGNHTKKFAIKHFQKPSDNRDYNFDSEIQHCLNIHKFLKAHNIPTWTTYRELQGENSILMTLGGNNNGEIIFSANNESKDTEKIIQDKIILSTEEIDDFFRNVINLLIEISKINIMIYFDSFVFNYDKEKINMIIGDFDRVEIDEDQSPFEDIIDVNIRRFATCLSKMKQYFDLPDTDISNTFYNFIVNLQKQNDPIISNFKSLSRINR